MRLAHRWADGSEERGPRATHACRLCGHVMPLDQHAHPCRADIDETEAEIAMENYAAAGSVLTEGDLYEHSLH